MIRTASDGKTIKTSATYDSAGNPLTVTDGNGNTTSLIHDAWDRPTKTITPMGIVTTYDYDANDNLTQLTRDAEGKAAQTTMTYDLLDNPTAIQSAQDADTIAITAMSYDPNENVSTTTLPS